MGDDLQEHKEGRGDIKEEIGKWAAINSSPSKYQRGQLGQDPTGGSGSHWGRCVQSSLTEGWGTGGITSSRSLGKGSIKIIKIRAQVSWRQDSRQASVTGKGPQAKKC